MNEFGSSFTSHSEKLFAPRNFQPHTDLAVASYESMGEANYTSRLLYEGSKAFWKFRCTLDLFIIRHSSLPILDCSSTGSSGKSPQTIESTNYHGDIIEVVGYNPSKDIESCRLYLKTDIIANSVSSKDLQAQIEKKKETALKNNRSFHLAGIQQEVEDQNCVNYVLARVVILFIREEGSNSNPNQEEEPPLIEIGLNPGYSDPINTETGLLTVLLQRSALPSLLQPHKIPRKKTVPIEEIKVAMEQLNKEQKRFDREVRIVEKQVRAVERQLFPTMVIPSTDSLDQESVVEGRRRHSSLFRSGSFLRRSMDDSHIMENTTSLSLLMREVAQKTLREEEEEDGEEDGHRRGKVSHTNHFPGLRLVSWDEEDERDRHANHSSDRDHHHPKSGLLLQRKSKKSKAMMEKKKDKEKNKYAQNLPKLHYLTPLQRPASAVSSTTPASHNLMASRSTPTFIPSATYLEKHPVHPDDEGKPSYARSTNSSRHSKPSLSTSTSNGGHATSTPLLHPTPMLSPLLHLDERDSGSSDHFPVFSHRAPLRPSGLASPLHHQSQSSGGHHHHHHHSHNHNNLHNHTNNNPPQQYKDGRPHVVHLLPSL